MDERLLKIYCMIQEIECERQAMIAENEARMHVGNAQAYNEDSFMKLVERLQNIRMEI